MRGDSARPTWTSGPDVTTVLVTGARGALGVRLCHLIAAEPSLTQLRRIDAIPGGRAEELKATLGGVDTMIHLGSSVGPQLDGTGAPGVDVEGTKRLLEAAGAAGVGHVIVLSSAMVYGAWPNNPVPLTESEPMRPNPELAFAVAKAEVERLVHEFRVAYPSIPVAVLRPTIALSEETSSWMARSLWQTGGVLPDDLEPPAQFVHLDDLAAAIDVARSRVLDGVFNVAPDGWIPPEQVRALAGPGPRLRLPERVAAPLARARWRLGLTPTPPEMLAYTVHPWVVAGDRLREAGWTPEHSNEEAFVVGVKAGPLADINPRRRQELALGAVGVALVGLVAVGVGLMIRAHRRRSG